MRKSSIYFTLAASLTMAACGDDTSLSQLEIEYNDNQILSATRVAYDPANGVLSIPNDLLFTGTEDGTLNLPVDEPTDTSDPIVAMSTLDGWSNQQAFILDFSLPEGVSQLSAASLNNPSALHIIQVKMGGPVIKGPPDECSLVPVGQVCKTLAPLIYGLDYVTQLADKDKVAVVWLKPLMSGASYLVALTQSIEDDLGRSVEASSAYISLRQDIDELPLGTDAQLSLQTTINSYEIALAETGVSLDQVIHSQVFTVQAAGNSIFSLKKALAQTAKFNPSALPFIQHQLDSGISIREVLQSAGVVSPNAPDCATATLILKEVADGAPISPENLASITILNGMCSGEYHIGSINLPYYLTESSPSDPLGAMNTPWRAMCDSGVILRRLTPEDIPNLTPGENDDACRALGLRDFGLDTDRNVTKFNPFPVATTQQNIKVQITLPNVDYIQTLNPNFMMPDTGWPVVILSHGLTSNKESMLILAASLSNQGFATVAIDMVLHGDRGFDINGSPESLEIVAQEDTPTVYMNLENLQVLLDNSRQSVVDLMGLRVGLATASKVGFADNKLDNDRVYFSGLSLGAMWGIDLVAVGNTPLSPEVDGLFKINAASFTSPGGGIASFLLESGTFGAFIQSSLILAPLAEGSEGLEGTELLAYQAAELYAGYLINQGVDITDPTADDFTLHYPGYREYMLVENPTALAAADSQVSSYAFAAQTMFDSSDPNTFAPILSETGTPILVHEIFGNGTPETWDNVIPPMTIRSPIAGTEPLLSFLAIPAIDSTVTGEAVSGFVRFNTGGHSSLLNATIDPRVTAEMHQQILSLFLSDGAMIKVNNDAVIVPAN